MNKFFLYSTLIISIILVFARCSKKAKYESMIKSGIESGVRHDTLFLGLYLGMSSEEFYTHCWELNKQGIIHQGDGNASVLYEMNDVFKSQVDVNFYPNFKDGKIHEMPVKYKYNAWAPWNTQYCGDTLQMEMLEVFQKWYGGGFMEIQHKTRGTAFVKVDGNRRISIYRDGSADGTVWALYTDLSIDKEAKLNEGEGTADQKNN